MKIILSKDAWRVLYESTLRKKKQAERAYRDQKTYIDESIKTQPKRWTEDFAFKHWHYMRLESAEESLNVQTEILKALEEAVEDIDDIEKNLAKGDK